MTPRGQLTSTIGLTRVLRSLLRGSYAGQMTELLNKVNPAFNHPIASHPISSHPISLHPIPSHFIPSYPISSQVNPGLKSRVSDVIDFPDFGPDAAAQLAAQQLALRRLTLPGSVGWVAIAPWLERLAAAPGWANGRDVETFVRRVAVECATRQTTQVTTEVLDAALNTVVTMKGGSEVSLAASVGLRSPSPSPFATAEPLLQAPPAFDLSKAVMFDAGGGGDDDDQSDDDDEINFADALEDAIVGLGYDRDDAARRKLASLLGEAADGRGPFPSELRDAVAAKTGASADAVDEALRRQAKPALVAVQAAIAYGEERRAQLDELDEDEREEAQLDEAAIMERLRTMGPCPAGFAWFRSGNGWRCGGGQHFVYDDDPILSPERD
jgi:hypothetical protein